MLTYQTSNPRAVYNPLRSIPLFRPAAAVFGPSATDRLVGDLRIELYALDGWQRMMVEARAALGKANRMPMTTRRWQQGQAMRRINQVRTSLRRSNAIVAQLQTSLLADGVNPSAWAI